LSIKSFKAFPFSILTPFLPFLLVIGNMLIPIVICKYSIPSFHGLSPFKMEWSECVKCLNNRNWFYFVFSGWIILIQACLSSIPFHFLSLTWYLCVSQRVEKLLKFFLFTCIAKQSSRGNSSFEGLLQTSDWRVDWVVLII